jgi:hypothetical protein
MSTLQAFTCKICGESFLVGINGRDISQAGGPVGTIGFAVGNDEVEKAPMLGAMASHCGKLWPIEDMKEVKTSGRERTSSDASETSDE